MDESKIKSDVLQKLIDMMEERSVGELKSKSPKFMKVETNDPEMAKEVVEEAIPMEPEMPMMEEKSESEDSDLARLMEMYKSIK